MASVKQKNCGKMQFKKLIYESYYFISMKYLQSYLDEFTFHYNLRNDEILVSEWLLYGVVK